MNNLESGLLVMIKATGVYDTIESVYHHPDGTVSYWLSGGGGNFAEHELELVAGCDGCE